MVGWGTLVLAIATILLVLATYATARTTAELDSKSAQRRRAENSAAAVRRYLKVSAAFDDVILPAIRADSARRLELYRADPGLASSEFIRTNKKAYLDRPLPVPLDDERRLVTDALRHTLDAVEELAMGVRLGMYDPYVVYNGVRTNLVSLYSDARTHIYRARYTTELRHSPSRTAYEHYSWLIESCFPALEISGGLMRLGDATKPPPELAEWRLGEWTDPRISPREQDPDHP